MLSYIFQRGNIHCLPGCRMGMYMYLHRIRFGQSVWYFWFCDNKYRYIQASTLNMYIFFCICYHFIRGIVCGTRYIGLVDKIQELQLEITYNLEIHILQMFSGCSCIFCKLLDFTRSVHFHLLYLNPEQNTNNVRWYFAIVD